MTVSKATYPKGTLERVPGKQNWVDRAGGLPRMIERIAAHLHYEKGMSIGHAIAVAVNAVKKGCATGDVNWPGAQQMNVKSRAAYCAAVTQWEAKKARARVSKGIRGRKLRDDEYIGMLLIDGISKRFFSMEERRKVTTFPGTTKFPVTDQASFNDAWGLRGNSSIPKEKVEAWLRRLAAKKGYTVPGGVAKSEFDVALEIVGLSKHGGDKHDQLSHGVWARQGGESDREMSREEILSHANLKRKVGGKKRQFDYFEVEGNSYVYDFKTKELRNLGRGKSEDDATREVARGRALRRQRKMKSKRRTGQGQTYGQLEKFDLTGEIAKIDEDQGLVFGWASVAKRKDGSWVVDKQGDVLDQIDAMENVAYDFVLKSRDGGEMHVRKGVSTLVESFVSTPEKLAALGLPPDSLPVGWWVGFKFNDRDVFKGVKSGKYKMFSVHGRGTRKALEG